MKSKTDFSFLDSRLNVTRRTFLKSSTAGVAALGAGGLVQTKDAKGFAYAPYPRDDELTTVVTSCAHNCGSRTKKGAQKKGNLIDSLSTDDARTQEKPT